MSDDKTTIEKEQKKADAPVFTDAEIHEAPVFYYEDNFPSLFDPLCFVLSIVVTSIIFALLWMTQ